MLDHILTPAFTMINNKIEKTNDMFNEMYGNNCCNNNVVDIFPTFDGKFPHIGRDGDNESILLSEFILVNDTKYIIVSSVAPRHHHEDLFRTIHKMSNIMKCINNDIYENPIDVYKLKTNVSILNRMFNHIYQKANSHQFMEMIDQIIKNPRELVSSNELLKKIKINIENHTRIHSLNTCIDVSISKNQNDIQISCIPMVLYTSMMQMYYLISRYNFNEKNTSTLFIDILHEKHTIILNMTFTSHEIENRFKIEKSAVDMDLLKLIEQKCDWKYTIRIMADRIEQMIRIPI